MLKEFSRILQVLNIMKTELYDFIFKMRTGIHVGFLSYNFYHLEQWFSTGRDTVHNPSSPTPHREI